MKLSRADSIDTRFWSRVDKGEGCWVWAGAHDKRGYGFIRFKTRQYRAHQLSWMMHRETIPQGFYVCHTCDNPPCVNPEHLFLGTHDDNMKDKQRKGRAAMKISPQQVQAIRRMANEGLQSQSRIAKQFNVHQSLVSRIVKGEVWPQ